MAPISLSDVPEEIVANIASNVSHKANLLSLALTSKQLLRIATQYLYHDYQLTVGDFGDRGFLESSLGLFLTRPNLAACVKHLTIRGEWSVSRDFVETSDPTRFLSTIRAAIQRLAQDTENGLIWLQNTSNHFTEDQLVILLITTLPNLKTLDTDLPLYPEKYYAWLLANIPKSHCKILERLQELVLIGSGTAHRANPETCLPYFDLPNLKRIYFFEMGSGLGDTENSGDNDESTWRHSDYLTLLKQRRDSSLQELSSVEYLELRNAWMDFETTCEMIGRCRSLKTFILEAGTNLFPFSHLVSTLSLHSTTLKNLSLDHLECSQAADQYLAGNAGLCFRQLNHLEHLKVQSTYLIGVDYWVDLTGVEMYNRFKNALPPSLRKVTLTQDGSYKKRGFVEHVLKPGFTNLHADLPRLEELCVVETGVGRWTHEEIERMASINNIKLRVLDFILMEDPINERGWGMEEEIHWEKVYHELEQRNAAPRLRPVDASMDLERVAKQIARQLQYSQEQALSKEIENTEDLQQKRPSLISWTTLLWVSIAPVLYMIYFVVN